MENEVKISIIVPVHNVEKYLQDCLESLINQTMEDIEIICVEDASSDGSADILRRYAANDERITAVYHEKNMGTLQARKDAVEISKGRYLMFVDSDDSLVLNACQTAYDAIEKFQTDMLQFDTEIIDYGAGTEKMLESLKKFLYPCCEKFENADLILKCWSDKKFKYTLWNKIYCGDLVRKAFGFIEDGYYVMAEDLYTFFVMAYYMHSYVGIKDKLYKYRRGTGVSGHGKIDLQRFDEWITEGKIGKLIAGFVEENNAQNIYGKIVYEINRNLRNDCVKWWVDKLWSDEEEKGFQHLIDIYGLEEVICGLADSYWGDRAKVAEKLANMKMFSKTDYEEPKTIAYYTKSIRNGGVERVSTLLCNIFSEVKDENGYQKYSVILITDDEDGRENWLEYPLNDKVKRAYLPAWGTHTKDNYRERLVAWNRVIEDYKIDVVINGMWCEVCTIWDLASIKITKRKPMYITHVHSSVCTPYSFEGPGGKELIYRYRLSDGVVTLSKCDTRFVSAFNPYVKDIVNPISFRQEENIQFEKKDNTIIWVGRIAETKNPIDVIYMMRKVVKDIPDARLFIVGSGDEELKNSMQSLIEAYGLQEHIIMTGFTLDVGEFYKKAAVYVGTSSYEGFPLSTLEAMSHGLPVVMYDIPWLTLVEDGRGIVTVKQKEAQLMAERVIELLTNEDERQKMGRAAKLHAEDIGKVDLVKEWTSLIDDICKKNRENLYESNYENILFEYLTKFQQKGREKAVGTLREKLDRTYAEKNEINRKLQITYDEKKECGIIIKEQQEEIKRLKEKLNNAEQQLKRINEFKLIRVAKKVYRKIKKIKK